MDAGTMVVVTSLIGILFAAFQFLQISKIKVEPSSAGTSLSTFKRMTGEEGVESSTEEKVFEIYNDIRNGAKAFLFAEYTVCLVFLVVFGFIVLMLTAHSADGTWDWTMGTLTCTAFAVGGITSLISGYIGMMVAVFSNARTTISAQADGPAGWTGSFNTAFRAGSVMGFSLCGVALLVMHALIGIFARSYDIDSVSDPRAKAAILTKLMEALSGYGLGGSSIALFGRVGGGIYTKAADVGADLAGKVVENIPEDDPRNPATIADNVGDNFGDVAGMGSDLFGSFAEGTCAALVVASHSVDIVEAGWGAIYFPLLISAVGIICCLFTSFIATNIQPVRCEEDVEKVLKVQLAVSTLLMTMVCYPLANAYLPPTFHIGSDQKGWTVTPAQAYTSVASGLWGGCIIGFVTEYYTSHSYSPTREVAQSCETGAATNIIYGLALGYKSAIIPVTLIAGAVYLSFAGAGMYGVALSALGFLGTLATCLSIDVYGPVCDNAGGIAEMAGCHQSVRDKTDALDAAGNTTAAIGKGFAIGGAALVSLALFGGFITRSGLEDTGLDVLKPVIFAMLFIGAMLPYWFTALTMKSVGVAAMEMVKEVKFQFATIPGLLEGAPGHGAPDHARCIKISTDAALREMVPPGLLVILSPILTGYFLGVEAVCGLLIGSIISAVQLAISQSNTGGAWDNAKKYVEKGCVKIEDKDGRKVVMGKGTEIHKAAVVGDTVGDPLKDTSGPALNIVMKLQAIISLVFADFFLSVNCGKGFFNLTSPLMDQICAHNNGGH